MLVELNVVEQRYRAVLEVLGDGASVTDVARRHVKAAANCSTVPKIAPMRSVYLAA